MNDIVNGFEFILKREKRHKGILMVKRSINMSVIVWLVTHIVMMTSSTCRKKHHK